jgi:excisionase family DNA binding protein
MTLLVADEVTVRQAAQLTGYSRQQIYNLVQDGKVRSRKPGWELWVDRKSLLAYCAAQNRGAVASK